VETGVVSHYFQACSGLLCIWARNSSKITQRRPRRNHAQKVQEA